MKKALKILVMSALGILFVIIIAGICKFNYLANQPGYDVDGNHIKVKENNE